MDIVKLLQDAGIEIPEDKVSALSESFTNALTAEVDPLKRTIEAVREDKEKLRQAKTDAEVAAEQAAQEALKKAGDMEGLEARIRGEMQSTVDAKQSELDKLMAKYHGAHKDAVINSLANKFIDPAAGRLLLENMVSVNDSENGLVATLNGLDKQPLTSDASKFGEALSGIEGLGSLLKGPDNAGGGAQGGAGSAGGAASNPDAAFKQRVKQALNL